MTTKKGDIDKIRTRIQHGSADDGGGRSTPIAEVGQMLAGTKEPEVQILSMARLDKDQARLFPILLQDSIRTQKAPSAQRIKELEKKGFINWHAHNRAGQIAILSSITSVAVRGLGRLEVVEAFSAGVTKFANKIMGAANDER